MNLLSCMPPRPRRVVPQPRVRPRGSRRRAARAPHLRHQPPGRPLLAEQHLPVRRAASFRETLTLPEPERSDRLRDPALRDRMRAEIAEPGERAFMFVWEVVNVEAVQDPANEKWVGRSVSDVAGEMGVDPLGASRPLPRGGSAHPVRAGGAARPARRRPPSSSSRAPRSCRAAPTAGPTCLASCGRGLQYPPPTGERPLSLEQAVQRITQVPAEAYGWTIEARSSRERRPTCC